MTPAELARLAHTTPDAVLAVADDLGFEPVADRKGIERFTGFEPDLIYREIARRRADSFTA